MQQGMNSIFILDHDKNLYKIPTRPYSKVLILHCKCTILPMCVSTCSEIHIFLVPKKEKQNGLSEKKLASVFARQPDNMAECLLESPLALFTGGSDCGMRY